jgi:hypothetical protein
MIAMLGQRGFVMVAWCREEEVIVFWQTLIVQSSMIKIAAHLIAS